jgi:hypothetical protein
MLSGEEPRKQKTRRPERRGITRAVSPKKIGERKKGNVPSSGTLRRREDPENGQRGSKSVTAAPWKSPMMAWSTVCDDYFRTSGFVLADHPEGGQTGQYKRVFRY